MLTVDYDRLGVRAGELLLDLGAGNGRHAYEAFRRGVRVVAADFNQADMVECRTMCAAMEAEGEAPAGGLAAAAVADGQLLPFPDNTFDRIIAAEVMEHIPDDEVAAAELARVLKPGGTIAITVPAWLPEVVCWKLSDEYHAPKVVGGHVRIYTERELRQKLAATGLEPGGSHQVHALPGRAPGGQQPPGQGLPPAPGVGHGEGPPRHATGGATPATRPGQEPRPVRPQTDRRRGGIAARPSQHGGPCPCRLILARASRSPAS